MDANDQTKLVRTFWVAVLLCAALPFIPYGRYVLYPFALLSTWAHEMGHGLTALLVGGAFEHLEIYQNLGGVAFNRVPDHPVALALVSMGGLIGPAVAGGLIIIMGARGKASKWVTGALAFGLILSLAVWVRNPFGIAAIGGLGLGFAAIAYYGGATLKLFVTQFTGIQFCLGSLADFDYMFTQTFMRGGAAVASDTQNIAEQLWLPYWFWGGLIAALSVIILCSAFYTAWVKPYRTSAPQQQEADQWM